MKRIYIIAMSAILLSACNESNSNHVRCDADDIAHCIDEYHYAECTGKGYVTQGCCSEEEISQGTCQSVCMMRDSGAVCENIQTEEKISVCGNQIVESGELCDGMQLNGHSCVDRYGILAEGQAVCDPVTCRVNYDNCRPHSTECGNGVLDLGEDCDGNEMREQSCDAEITNATGTLKCTSQCKYDYSDCQVELCGNGEINEGESCDGSVPNNLTCAHVARGMQGNLSCNAQCKIDISDCHWPKMGDLCIEDEYPLQICDDNNQAIQCKDGVIHIADCTKQSEDCVLIQNEDSIIARCMPDRLKCQKPGEIGYLCDADGYSSVQMACTQTENDHGSYWMEFANAHVDQCPYSCSSKTGKCARLVPDQGEECDPDTFDNHCDGNIRVNCQLQTFRHAIEAEECTKCDMFNELGNRVAVCVNDKQTCKPGDEDMNVCYNGDSLQMSCVQNAAGDKAYWMNKKVSSCKHGCNAETGECVKLYDKEGDSCKNWIKNKCLDGDVLIYCSDDMHISAIACNADGNGYCSDGKCYELCEKAGTKRTTCLSDEDAAYTVTEECRNIGGRLSYEVIETETCGSGYCNYNGDACYKISDVDGDPCVNGYNECDGDIMIICDNGKKVAYDCIMYEMVCADSKSYGAYCMEPCSKPGETTTMCEYYDENYGYVKYDMVCETDPNGVKYYNPISTETCPGGCSADGSDCEYCELGQTDSYCSDYDDTYITFYAACQDDGKGGTVFDYLKDESGNYVYDECPAGCDDSGKQCRIVVEGQGDPCTAANYDSNCHNGYALTCSNSGYVAAAKCASGRTCHVSEHFGAACVGSCSEEMPVTRFCSVYTGYGAVLFDVACENVDGNLYEFQEFIGYCDKGCNKTNTGCAL